MTILDSPDALARAIAQLTFTLETLLKVETAIQEAMAAIPNRKQYDVLTQSDAVLGDAAHNIARGRLLLVRLEKMR